MDVVGKEGKTSASLSIYACENFYYHIGFTIRNSHIGLYRTMKQNVIQTVQSMKVDTCMTNYKQGNRGLYTRQTDSCKCITLYII